MHSISKTRRVAAAALAGLVATGALTACGGSGSTADPAGVLTVASPYPTVSLNPLGTSGADNGTMVIARQIFSRLVEADKGKFVPSLASSWTTSPDARTWTFTLRSAKFSDNTAVTAADVKASLAQVVAQHNPNGSTIADATVTATGTHKVRFTFAESTPGLLGALTQFYVVPAAHAADKNFFAKPVGSGPFKVKSFTANQRVVLVPNPHYWGPKPKLHTLTFRVISEMAARVTALTTGEIQATWGLPDDQVAQVKDTDGISVASTPGTGVYSMWFNSSRPALSKTAVRTALWRAVDFKTIIASLYPETGSLADSPIAPSVSGYAKQRPVGYDPTAAKKALKAAGFDFGKKLTLQYSGSEFTQFAAAVASDLAKIGVKLDPVQKEKSTWLSDLLGLKFDINLQALSTPTQDASTNLGRLYTCAAKRTGYCDKDLDTVLDSAAHTADDTQRAALYGKAAGMIWDAAVGMYPMFVRIVYATRSSVHGLALDPNFIPSFATVSVS